MQTKTERRAEKYTGHKHQKYARECCLIESERESASERMSFKNKQSEITVMRAFEFNKEYVTETAEMKQREFFF